MENANNIIDTLFEKLNQPKRATNGRDLSKNYHKITISVSLIDKKAIQNHAKENNITVSQLIKNLLKENNIITG